MSKYIYPKRIRSVLRGENPKVQVGYINPNIRTLHQIGDVWEDENGEWEQKNGYKVKVPKIDANIPLFCPKCKNVLGKASKDMHVYWKFGFCLSCLIERDAKMITEGTFQQYEKQYIRSKQRGFYSEAKAEIGNYLEEMKKGYIEFVNEKGEFEKWTVDEKIKEFWENELKFVDSELEKIEKEEKQELGEKS